MCFFNANIYLLPVANTYQRTDNFTYLYLKKGKKRLGCCEQRWMLSHSIALIIFVVLSLVDFFQSLRILAEHALLLPLKL